MERFVTAVFESNDAADLARARLGRSGVRFSHCEISETGNVSDGDDLRLVVNPYNPIFSNNIGENWGSFAGANMMKYGGFLYIHDRDGRGSASASAAADAAGRSGEVLMRLLVDERDADLCEAILVSEHGARVRIG